MVENTRFKIVMESPFDIKICSTANVEEVRTFLASYSPLKWKLGDGSSSPHKCAHAREDHPRMDYWFFAV